MSVQIAKRLITVEEYHKMGEIGILTEEDRVELINGEIIKMSPIGSPHAGTVKIINELFTDLLKKRVLVSIQDPITISKYSEPEPDIAILKRRSDFYKKSHPTPSDIFLLMEVSHSTLGYDRDYKLSIYAKAEISECWIVNIEDNQVEVYRHPKAGKYCLKETFLPGEMIFLEQFNITIKVNDVLGIS